MKKVINGKVYDTKTAERVAEWDNGYPVNDFHHVDEELYRKKTGEFFTCGSGGPLTQYAEWHGNSGSGGERIIPLAYEEATKWAEEKLDGDDYENIFGEVSEDESKVKVTFYISGASADKLRKNADKAGLSLSEYLDKIITEM